MAGRSGLPDGVFGRAVEPSRYGANQKLSRRTARLPSAVDRLACYLTPYTLSRIFESEWHALPPIAGR
jgi:hypothetical protein